MQMDENLKDEFLNLEFRILVVDEALKELEERAKALLCELEEWKQKYVTASDEDDYWTAD
jgi:hypothetical protein